MPTFNEKTVGKRRALRETPFSTKVKAKAASALSSSDTDKAPGDATLMDALDSLGSDNLLDPLNIMTSSDKSNNIKDASPPHQKGYGLNGDRRDLSLVSFSFFVNHL